MLRITVELLPYGSETNKKILGMAEIINDLTGDADNGNYQVKIWKLNDNTGRLKLWKKGNVKNFLRQKLTVWHLLSKALKENIKDKEDKHANRIYSTNN